MSLQAICDGCHTQQSAEQEFVQRGLLRKCDYCLGCADIIDDYTKARDDLHTQVAETWYGGIAAIRAEFDDNNPEFERPDE